MTKVNRSSSVTLILCTLLVLLSGIGVVRTVQAAPLALPPRPSPVPAPKNGGAICLNADFGTEWPWDSIQWQEIWTVVQWQDEWGYWHNVEGWQGTLDSVTASDQGKVVGEKTWWVAETDLGKGPFRWVVYRGRGGKTLATSAAFVLPSSAGQTMLVQIPLGMP